jgi:hypothetical protein
MRRSLAPGDGGEERPLSYINPTFPFYNGGRYDYNPEIYGEDLALSFSLWRGVSVRVALFPGKALVHPNIGHSYAI